MSHRPAQAEVILADLVALPVLPGAANAAIVDYVRNHLARIGIVAQVLPGPEGDRCNLFATIGPREVPGTILSGHMDVVPVEGQVWTTDPFRLTLRNGRLQGRGTADMKGFLACVLAAAPELAALPLVRPLHLAFSYDEEIGCRGVPHLIEALPGLCARPAACIVGEPSDMHPVLSHKGKQALELTVTGRAAHSSTPDRGTNAIYPAAELLLALRDMAGWAAEKGPTDPRFDPPFSTVVAGVVRGGNAVNIIPDRCVIEMEVRAVPGQDPRALGAEALSLLAALPALHPGIGVSHRELSSYPALPPPEDPTLTRMMERLTGLPAIGSVSYGTEAGLYHAAGIASIICGPASITRAHRPDEFILPEELDACIEMLRALGREHCPG